MSRINQTFSKLQSANRTALIPFITAGHPHPSTTVDLMHRLVKSGADIIELGVPFSDPMADGPIIQRASESALRHGVSLKMVLEFVSEFRKLDSHTPIVLMGYANPIERMGIQTFASCAKDAGVDGVLIVDYPPEESIELYDELAKFDIDTIFLLAPTSTRERIEQVAKVARGYVYYVSLKGVTGSGALDLAEINERIPLLKSLIQVPIGVGFGIRDGKTAKVISNIADGVVIGSRIIQELESAEPSLALKSVELLISDVRSALDE